VPKAKTLKASKSARQNRRGASARTAASVQPNVFRQLLKSLHWLLAVIPWQRCLLHLSIFCFWLVILTGLIYGARWVDQPITRIEVVGNFDQIRQDLIQAELAPVLKQSFFTLELAAIQRQLEARPWVKMAIVERRWPNVLRVRLVEEQAVALWNDRGFINVTGDVLVPEHAPLIAGLPVFYGDGQQVETMLSAYRNWQSQLAVVDLKIKTLRLEPRGAWQIGFDGDWSLKLGKADVAGRLQRFIAVYGKRLYKDVGKILTIDARYTQGIAVAWKEVPLSEPLPEQS
jgi:cell division protein FtsQ